MGALSKSSFWGPEGAGLVPQCCVRGTEQGRDVVQLPGVFTKLRRVKNAMEKKHAANYTPHMNYFIPEWDDRVDPDYDFLTDTATEGRDPYSHAVYAHEIYPIKEFPQLIDYYIRYREDHDAEALARSISEVTGVEQVFIRQVIQLVEELKDTTEFYKIESDNAYDEAMERIKYLKHVIEDCDG